MLIQDLRYALVIIMALLPVAAGLVAALIPQRARLPLNPCKP